MYQNDLAIETLIARVYEDCDLLEEEYDITKDEAAERNIERLLFAINRLKSKAEALFHLITVQPSVQIHFFQQSLE